jgi:hypothetical protein
VVALVAKDRLQAVQDAGLRVLFWSEPSAGIEVLEVAAL